MQTKRYILFVGEAYYPMGGWFDYSGRYDTIEEAKKAVQPFLRHSEHNWYHIVDLERDTIIEPTHAKEEYERLVQ